MNAQDREDLKELTGEFRGFVKEWNNKREDDGKFHGRMEKAVEVLESDMDAQKKKSNVFDAVIAVGTLVIFYIQSRVKIL